MSLFFGTHNTLRTDLFDAACRLLGYECNLSKEASPNAEPRPSGRSGFFAFERRTVNAVTSEYWGLGCYMLVCNLRRYKQQLGTPSADS